VGHPKGEGGGGIADLRSGDVYARAAHLVAEGRPFALATVVAVKRPTSARPGAHGIVHPDGSIEGWVGGSCAQPVVIREALRALADGQPRLLRISKEPPSDARRGDGIVELVMTCHSGGTLEINVEPVLPSPLMWVVGTTPICGALVELGAAAGYAVTLIDPVATHEAFPAAELVVTDTNLRRLDAATPPYVIVASQGQWDEEALESVLGRDVAYVGLVASPTRAAVVREYLLEQANMAPERVAAVRAPAGLDLGAETPAEVALSILAELVQVRRGRAPFVAAPGPATLAGARRDETQAEPVAPSAAAGGIVLLDPVCHMTVDEGDVRHLAEHEGVIYAFCSLGCRTRFIKDPAAFVPRPNSAVT
jgi:xanthine dehydrogenase accessory factor